VGTTESDPDVVIVGGGFAGVTTARELTMRGRSAVLLEARDRLGGRTYTVEVDGHRMEFGGTWIHPIQSNVWSECKRYGLETEALPVLEGLRSAIVSGGKVVDLDDAAQARAMEAFGRFCSPGATLFPMPYSDSGEWGPDPQGYGDLTVRQGLTAFEAPQVEHDWVEAFIALTMFAPLDQAALTEILRSYAESGCSPEQTVAMLGSSKVSMGMKALIEAIASQATRADIRLSAPVRRVVQTADGVRVELQSGEVVAARTGVITLPMNVLNSVEFDPKLSDVKRTASDQRHAGGGNKLIVRVKGDIGNVNVMAPETDAANWAVTYHREADATWVVVFVADHRKLAFGDVPGTQAALQRLLPGIEVDRIVGHDWTNDPLALGTWCILHPGQLKAQTPELRRTEGRLFFAGADSAPVWRSFIDGAIASGYRAARDIDNHLTGGDQARSTADLAQPAGA
jgi:pseudooxynicotine oxidase